MENNEIMNYEEFGVMEDEVVAEESTGIGTGVAMLIGAGLTLAVGAGVKLVKKGIAAIKAKKEAKEAANKHDFCVEDQATDNVDAK